jgi:aryl-alcohol dehydrogenase-like predicted oxidoreductase
VEYRQLGNSELRVSVVGLGGNTFGPPRLDEATSRRVIDAALELGINFVDTAHVYGEGLSEEFIGRALEGRRQRMVIATKFGLRDLGGMTARERIHQLADQSLRRLRTDYIDLYQIHVPNPAVAPDEIVRALDDLVRAGKVREIGCCNYASWRVAESVFTARTLGTKRFITAQNHYNLLRRRPEQEVLPFCEAYHLSFIPYFPLGGGFLTGKYRRGEPAPPGTRGAAGSPIVKWTSSERNWALLAALEPFAREHGHTVLELAIAWLIANETVGSVICGASNGEQVAMNAKAAEWKLTADVKQAADALAPPESDNGPYETRG